MWDLSSPTRDGIHTSCIGRSLNHWTAREVPEYPFLKVEKKEKKSAHHTSTAIESDPIHSLGLPVNWRERSHVKKKRNVTQKRNSLAMNRDEKETHQHTCEKKVFYLGLCLCPVISFTWASLVSQMVRNLPVMQDTQVPSLGQEDLLE